MHSSLSYPVYFEAAGEAAGLAVGFTAAEAFGLAAGDGEGIAGLVETTGTLGLIVGVTTFDLHPPSIATSINPSVIIADIFFILKPPK